MFLFMLFAFVASAENLVLLPGNGWHVEPPLTEREKIETEVIGILRASGKPVRRKTLRAEVSIDAEELGEVLTRLVTAGLVEQKGARYFWRVR